MSDLKNKTCRLCLLSFSGLTDAGSINKPAGRTCEEKDWLGKIKSKRQFESICLRNCNHAC